tara:strand:+ start:2165 stop:2290 length:126 start_codon:yes stop_codon:yes gene_type:complete
MSDDEEDILKVANDDDALPGTAFATFFNSSSNASTTERLLA